MQLISNSKTNSYSVTLFTFNKWELVMANPIMVGPEAIKHFTDSLMADEPYVMSFNWKYAVFTERVEQ